MVWCYTEYSKCPTLTDWTKKCPKFSITLDADIIEIKPLKLETPLGSINSLEFKTNNILRPRFYMRVGQNKSSLLNLELDLAKGLVKRIWSEGKEIFEVNGLPGEYHELKTQRIDTGNFDNFMKIGKYAIRRFPKIADEISSHLESDEDIPDDEIETIKKYSDKINEIPSLDIMQKELSKDFYKIFIIYTIYENVDNKISKRKNPFTKEEMQKLYDLVKPLKD